MGRPLKIQKTSTGSGNGGAAVSVDIAFPNFGSLTAPVVNTANTLDSAQYLGVVGGAAPTDTPSATNPRVDVTVNIANPSGTGLGVAQGYIIRQKGSHKYLVGDVTGVNDGSFLVGQAYQISTLGTTTDWPAAGAPPNYGLGTVFTATSVGGSGNGAANSVGVCVLADDVTPAAGLMSITFTFGDSTATTISKLTNKFLLDWTGGSTYADTSVIADKRYVTNFFTDEGTVIKSGTTGAANTGTVTSGQQNLLDLAIVDNVTS
jgi:hypothetical protein